MAHEVRGNLSEAAVILALEELGYVYDINVHWHHTPADLKVCKSDVTLGADPERPDVIFQVCSSGYEGGYQKKFWRDMGELLEVRRVLPSCRVISVIFEPGTKEKLTKVYDFVSDGVLHVTSLVNGHTLLNVIERVGGTRLPSDLEQQLQRLKATVGPLTRELAKAIGSLMQRRLSTWQIEHTPRTLSIRSELNFRKAILCGSLFTSGRDLDTARPSIVAAERGQPLPQAPFLEALSDVGVCRICLGNRYRVADANLQGCIREVGSDYFCHIMKKSILANPQSRVIDYVATIQRLPDLAKAWYQAIRHQYDKLCKPSFMSESLRANFSDFALYVAPGAPHQNEPWLFRRLLDVVRAADEKHFAIGIPRFDPEFGRRGLSAFRFICPEYIAGRRALSRAETDAVAAVLCPELQRVRASVTASLQDQFVVMARRSEFNQRLLTYRGFDPLPTILKERFGMSAATLSPPVLQSIGVSGAATCEGSIAGDTISMWQSASKDGVAHKVKENVGRLGLCCLRVKIKNGKKRFTLDSALRHRVLYVDGTWGDREIEAVLAGGFTDVKRLV